MAIAVMLNNFFHDFAVAMLACSLISVAVVCGPKMDLPLEAKRRVYAFFNNVTKVCWTWIIIGGAVRSWAYEDYEWLPAAGRGQVAALVLKHILLVSLIVFGVMVQLKIGRALKQGSKED